MAHHEVSGRLLLQPRAAGLGLAGGLLAELMLAGTIEISPGGVAVTGLAPPDDALAREVLGQVLGEHAQRPHGTGWRSWPAPRWAMWPVDWRARGT
jgi:Golgi phosphoprotein 3 (GPP34)